MEINRKSKEYRLAEKIVHLEIALELANHMLKNNHKLGVIPNQNVRFKDGNSFHKKVRKIIMGI